MWLDMAFSHSSISWNHRIQAEAERVNFGNRVLELHLGVANRGSTSRNSSRTHDKSAQELRVMKAEFVISYLVATPYTTLSHRQVKTDVLKNFRMCSSVPNNSSLPFAPAFCNAPCNGFELLYRMWLSHTFLSCSCPKSTGASINGTSITSSVFSFHDSLPLMLVSGESASSQVPFRRWVSSKLKSRRVRRWLMMKDEIWEASSMVFSTSMTRSRLN